MARAEKFNTVTEPAGVRQIVQATKALAHPVRLRILAMLKGRTVCVCQMTSVLALAYPTVSGHLNELRRSRLVIEDKQGKLVFYRLDASSPFAALVAGALALAAQDEIVEADRVLIDRVRAVPIPVLTRAGLDLKRVGIRRPQIRAASAPRR